MIALYHPSASTLDSSSRTSASTSSSNLESLPYDVLEIIFLLACTDGGRTGCSLSLVSKAIRITSCAARFHSVAVFSGTSSQLIRFLEALNNAHEEARVNAVPVPRVQHLCISLTPALDNIHIGNIPYQGAGHGRRWPQKSLSPLGLEVWNDYHSMFRSLCATVSSDLETLCILRPTSSKRIPNSLHRYLPPIPEVPCPNGFPRLRELTFTEGCQPPFVATSRMPAGTGDDASPTNAPATLYPALKRLHMSMPCYSDMDFGWWAMNAPHLTWLSVNTWTSPSPHHTFYFMPRLERAIGKSLSENADMHGQNTAPVRSCFSELNTLTFMVHPVFESSPAKVAMYKTFLSSLGATLSSFGVPRTFLQPRSSCSNWGDRQSDEVDKEMRMDWFLGIEGREVAFTPEIC